MTLRALLCLVVGLTPALGAPRELLVCDFETPAGGTNLGAEFPGAQGRFFLTREAARTGRLGGCLEFDLTRGQYVGWAYDLPSPLAAGAQTISVWVKAQHPGWRVHCKTRDATGQEHLRVHAGVPAGRWVRLDYPVERMDAHWSGANDGRIHWPITYVQIGVEAPGSQKTGRLLLDDVTVATAAPASVQPGVRLRVETGRFGSLFRRGERPQVIVSAAGLERQPPMRYAGVYVARDWQERVVARGAMEVPVRWQREGRAAISLPPLPAGAFQVDVALMSPADRAEVVRASGWLGVLAGPRPAPCTWVGTGVHGGHGWAYGDLRFLDILSEAGIGVVREEFPWSAIEKARGEYATTPEMEAFVNGLNRRGIRLNLLLTYGNPIYENPCDPDAYARWAAWMADHFRGRVRDFEVWNEPQNFLFRSTYGGDYWGPNATWIPRFVELSRKAGDAIRAVRPDADVIVCSEDVWPILTQMLELGIGPAGNIISIHPYCHGQPRPEREFFLNDGGKELRTLSRRHGGPDRVVITEAGWTTYVGKMRYLEVAGGYPRCSFVQQAQYIVRMYLTARAAGAEYACQYDFRNDGADPGYTEHNFGLVHLDGSPKPSLIAVAALTRLLGQGRFVRDLGAQPERLRAYLFEVDRRPVVAAYAVEGEATLSLPVGVGSVTVADLMGNRRAVAAPGGVLTLHLTETPVYILGARMDSLAR